MQLRAQQIWRVQCEAARVRAFTAVDESVGRLGEVLGDPYEQLTYDDRCKQISLRLRSPMCGSQQDWLSALPPIEGHMG